jgi:hypothetical protein
LELRQQQQQVVETAQLHQQVLVQMVQTAQRTQQVAVVVLTQNQQTLAKAVQELFIFAIQILRQLQLALV